MHTRVLSACPLLGGLSSFGVSLSEVSLVTVEPLYKGHFNSGPAVLSFVERPVLVILCQR